MKKPTTKNRSWVHKESEEKLVNKQDLNNFLSDGWERGRLYSVKKKCNNKTKDTFRKWLYNPITNEKKLVKSKIEFDQLKKDSWKEGMGKVNSSKKYTTQSFIEKAKEIHGNVYDYSLVEYKNSHSKINIICNTHGVFEQKPYLHLQGQGCVDCRNDSFKNNYSYSIDIFIEKAKEIHGNVYDYSLVEYKNSHDKVKIVCKKHGEFEQLAYMHLQGQGCPRCVIIPKKSNAHIELENFIKELNIEVQSDVKIFDNVKQSVDLFCPDYNFAIEQNGSYWHSDEFKDKWFHLKKREECLEKGITLFHISDYEQKYKFEIIKSMIKNKFGLIDRKIDARKCVVREVDKNESYTFQNENHIQGKSNASLHLGLFYKNELVSVMTFSKPRMNKQYEWEMIRYCNKLDNNVRGGASKLFNYFVNQYKPNSIITYANKRYSNGQLYEKLGFEHLYDSEPSYYYSNGHIQFSRFACQKKKLKEKFPEHYSETNSESEIMKNAGFYKVFDCGNRVFSKVFS